MLFKYEVYICRICKNKWRTADIEILPEWEKDFDEEHLKELSEKEYYIQDAWCRECAEKKGYILFDSKHPVVKYRNQRKQYKMVVSGVFKEVAQRFLENITNEVLWQLNPEAFDWFMNGTKCGKQKAAKAYCRDVEKQIRKCIENEIYSNQNVIDEKAKLEPLRDKMFELMKEYPYGVKGLISLKVNDEETIAVYSDDPDDFFIWKTNKHIGGRLKDLVETEDKISGRLWTAFFKDFTEILSV